MASVQVLFWKHIPSQVKAWEGQAQVKRMLPEYFQAAIEAYATKDGPAEADSYDGDWRWGPVEERAGAPHEALATMIDELTVANPRARLMNPDGAM